jgi:hypothetical protein
VDRGEVPLVVPEPFVVTVRLGINPVMARELSILTRPISTQLSYGARERVKLTKPDMVPN